MLQDINAEEAKKDWKGETANTVQSKLQDIKTVRETIRSIKQDKEEIEEYEDWTAEEQDLLRTLQRDYKSAQ
jgi:flagellar motility protein MotE (MotC chaperone)